MLYPHNHPQRLGARLLGLFLGAALCVSARAETPAWGIGPFHRPAEAKPVLEPRDTLFADPMTGKDVAWEKDHVFNPAAVVRNGRIYLLYRAEDDSGTGIGHHTSRVGLAESRDGVNFTRRPTPVLYPDNDDQKKYDWPGGCEDPRVVEAPDGSYVMTYTAWNRDKARLSVASSPDLIRWTKHGPVFEKAYNGRFLDLWSKAGAIVTQREGDRLVAVRISGLYWMLWGEGTVYAATSPDLIEWTPVVDRKGDLIPVMKPRPGRFDSALAEPGPPVVLTDAGIVMLYNGKNANRDGDPTLKPGAYAAGQALLDPRNPTRVLARTETPFLSPAEAYEDTGQYVAGTVFIEGLVPYKGRWWLYFGAADSMVGVAMTDATR